MIPYPACVATHLVGTESGRLRQDHQSQQARRRGRDGGKHGVQAPGVLQPPQHDPRQASSEDGAHHPKPGNSSEHAATLVYGKILGKQREHAGHGAADTDAGHDPEHDQPPPVGRKRGRKPEHGVECEGVQEARLAANFVTQDPAHHAAHQHADEYRRAQHGLFVVTDVGQVGDDVPANNNMGQSERAHTHAVVLCATTNTPNGQQFDGIRSISKATYPCRNVVEPPKPNALDFFIHSTPGSAQVIISDGCGCTHNTSTQRRTHCLGTSLAGRSPPHPVAPCAATHRRGWLASGGRRHCAS